MRIDPPAFAAENQASSKEPRYVCAIIFDAGSIYVSSHASISNVPGTVISGALVRPSAVSQRIRPEDGRAEIGSLSFELIDRGGTFTAAARDLLDNSNLGLRGKTVRFYVGYGNDFTGFQLFQTQVVQSAEYEAGTYTIGCQDIQRQTRETIFESKVTNLRDSVSATDTTIPVYSTADFTLVLHGTSWSDAPSSTVGYIQVEQEIIRYTGKTADSFTGCTRGVLNTRAAPHTVSAETAAERRAKVSEVIYLELPAVKLAYAILTGDLYGDSATLPAHWHLGIDQSLVREADFTDIGFDLWNPSADTQGLVLRFVQPGRQDGKRFLETEVLQLAACYMPVYSTGELGLRRLEPILRDAPAVVTLTEDVVTAVGPLQHDMKSMFNRLRVDWNWNGSEFTRSTQLVDADSIARHGVSEVKTVRYRGLFGSRHTDAIITDRLNSLRDRFSAPPERISVGVLPSLNRLEVGDVVRLRIANLRDYAGPDGGIDRSFEVQSVTVDFASGDVRLELFGSTDRAGAAPIGSTSALPDAYYTSQGVALSTVATINDVGGVGVIQSGSYNLTGNADLNAAGAVYYHDGDLELASGATLTVNNNVQIRVKGFFTINGTIDGVGRGQAGVASSGTVSFDSGSGVASGTPNPGARGFVGNSRGMDGVFRYILRVALGFFTVPATQTLGYHASAPLLSLAVDGNALRGLPGDLRGTSGGGGGKARVSTSGTTHQGGTGANSGAGLAIVCRGAAFGASGSINLSGASPAATSMVDLAGVDAYPGAGGAGGPGTLYLLLDNPSASIPDLAGKFTATTGTVPVNGNPLPGPKAANNEVPDPKAGYLDPAFVQFQDLSNAAHRIQYIPAPETPQQDSAGLPPAPTALAASGQTGFNLVTIGLPPPDQFSVVEVWASIDDDRTNATKITEGLFDSFVHTLPGGATRYYWARTKRVTPAGVLLSAWYPNTTTTAAYATATSVSDGPPGESLEVQYSVNGSTGWHFPFESGDLYMRQRVGSSGAWSAAIRIVGETGAAGPAGNYIDTVFRRAATAPATPTGDTPSGWSDSPPADDGNPLWFSQGEKTAAGALVGSWTAPVRISGTDGSDGTDGEPGTTALNAGSRMDRLDRWFNNETQTTTVPTPPWSIETVNGPVSGLGMRYSGSSYVLLFSERITLTPGKKYRVSLWARQPTGSSRSYLLVAFYDSSGNVINTSANGWLNIGTYHYWGRSDQAFASSWTQYAIEFGGDAVATVPAGAVAFSIGGLISFSVVNATTIELQDYRVSEVAADGLTLSLSNTAFTVRCDGAGVPLSGAFDGAAGQATIYSGTRDVTALATFAASASGVTGSVNTATNTPVTGAKGSYRVTEMAADSGHLEITATYNGVQVKGRFTLTKVRNGLPGAAVSVGPTGFVSPFTSTSYVAACSTLELAVGPGGTITASASSDYLGIGSSGTRTLTLKIQYRIKGDTTWIDMGSAQAGSASVWIPGDAYWEPGSCALSRTLAGPGAVTIYEFRLAGLVNNANGVDQGGVFAVSWNP